MCSDWGIDAADLTCNRQNLTADEIAAVIEQAVLFVNDVTCGQFDGPCSTTIRPLTDCAPADACTCHGAWPRLDLYQWVTGPIVTVDQVSVDGEIVPADNYHLWEHRFLGPVDPDGSTSALDPWPEQNMRKLSGPGTWSITVTHGAGLPVPLRSAVVELASQLGKRCCGEDCDLPDNATSVSRGGVTVSLATRQEGKVGVQAIDMALERYGCPKVSGGILDPLRQRAMRS